MSWGPTLDFSNLDQNPAYVIMTWQRKQPQPAVHFITSFEIAIAAGLPLDTGHVQLILNAYGVLHPELEIVAQSVQALRTARANIAISPISVLDNVATAHWQNMGRTNGFLKLHAALIVGGHLETWQKAVTRTAASASDFLSNQQIAVAQNILAVAAVDVT